MKTTFVSIGYSWRPEKLCKQLEDLHANRLYSRNNVILVGQSIIRLIRIWVLLNWCLRIYKVDNCRDEDPDPLLFSTDPDPTYYNGYIKSFEHLEQNINQNQQIQTTTINWRIISIRVNSWINPKLLICGLLLVTVTII